MGIIVNVDECIGCHACFIACKQENQVSPNIQWNRIRKVENREKNIINYFRASCQHCEDPACLKVCPMKAVYKGPHGEILIDQDKCIACKACLAACPYGMPMFNDQKLTSYFGEKQPLFSPSNPPTKNAQPGKAEHCTLCSHRLAKGKEPACVEICPAKALTLVDFDAPTEKQKALLAKAVSLHLQQYGFQRSCPEVAFKYWEIIETLIWAAAKPGARLCISPLFTRQDIPDRRG